MSIKGNMKEAAGFVKEEAGEAMNNEKMAHEGRDLRNEGRMQDGELPKTTPVPVGADKDAKKEEAKRQENKDNFAA